jgi:hypothetical protein
VFPAVWGFGAASSMPFVHQFRFCGCHLVSSLYQIVLEFDSRADYCSVCYILKLLQNYRVVATFAFPTTYNLGCVAMMLAVGGIATNAQDASGTNSSQTPDKSHYNLLNPTPDAFMREMSTDRPDKTESPYTVDAGHFQLEMDLVSYGYDRDTSEGSDTRTEALAVAPVNLKIGLFNNIDFQVILETYNYIRVIDRASGTVRKMSGFGDVTTRLKINLWGNDSGPTACGVMPFVKLPTNQDHLGNDAVEGGVIIPLAVQLPHGWDMGAMTEVDFLRDENGGDHHASFVNSVTFGHGLFGKLDGYAEFFSEVSTEKGERWIGTVDFGLTYQITPNIQLDTGINIGVTKAAPDFNPFVGLSWRF